MGGRGLADTQRERLRPLLPPRKPRTGRPAGDRRTVPGGSLWILRTGAPWRDRPRQFGSRGTVAGRFHRRRRDGVRARIRAALRAGADAAGRLDRTLHCGDGTTARAPQHAAGAEGSDGGTEALGRSRGGFPTEIRVRAERRGEPVACAAAAGRRHEQAAVEGLPDRGAVRRRGRGRPRLRPDRLGGDKGYSSGEGRRASRRRGIGAAVPRKTDERRDGRFDRGAHPERNVAERLITRLKQGRRLARRDEKRATDYAAMLTIAATPLWL